MTLDSNLQAFATLVGQDMKAVAAAQVTLARAVPGAVLRCPWNGTAWTYAGAAPPAPVARRRQPLRTHRARLTPPSPRHRQQTEE